jgi:hypothetical protein
VTGTCHGKKTSQAPKVFPDMDSDSRRSGNKNLTGRDAGTLLKITKEK